jgi:hypothetical protein
VLNAMHVRGQHQTLDFYLFSLFLSLLSQHFLLLVPLNFCHFNQWRRCSSAPRSPSTRSIGCYLATLLCLPQRIGRGQCSLHTHDNDVIMRGRRLGMRLRTFSRSAADSIATF